MFGARRSRRRGQRIPCRGRWRPALCALAWVAGAAVAEDFGPVDSPSPPALVAQARAFEHGEGVRRDLPKAAELYCRAARDGNPDAQYSLGWMYAIGRGVTRDDAIAGTLLDLAAAAGHPDAQRALALVGTERASVPDCVPPPPLPVVAIELLPPAPAGESPDPFAGLPPAKQKIAQAVAKLAPRYAIDLRLALAIVAVESNFEPGARSPKDARGLMQLIPDTAARFSVKNPHDVNDNVRGGLAYLRWLLAYYQGQVPLAAAAYNAGERAVDRYRGIPPYPETRDYVQRVLRLFGNAWHPYDARVVAPTEFLVSDDDDPS